MATITLQALRFNLKISVRPRKTIEGWITEVYREGRGRIHRCKAQEEIDHATIECALAIIKAREER